MYRLRTSPASPFGRKVALAAATGLANRLVIEPADVNDPNDSLLEQNPLGKIPTLITPEGQTLFDSRVIIEFLDDKAGGGVVIPRDDSRWAVLRQQTLADGLMDAALLVVYEDRYRPAEERSPGWVARQQERMARALDYAELHYTFAPGASAIPSCSPGSICFVRRYRPMTPPAAKRRCEYQRLSAGADRLKAQRRARPPGVSCSRCKQG